MKLTEEFTLEGKSFVYIDLSKIDMKGDFAKLFEVIKSVIAKYPANSLYTITNVADVRFDSELKEILANFIANNAPYVKYGAIIGGDGIKKIIVKSIIKISGRTNFLFAFSKEQAIELLMKQE